MPRRLGRVAGCLVSVSAVAALSSCTGDEPRDALPSPTDAVDSFIAAWNARDAREMAAHLDALSARRWSPGRLRTFMRRTMRQGSISSFTVERSDAVEGPEDGRGAPPQASAPYEISYASEAAVTTSSLEGELSLALDRRRDEWRVRWSRGLMWPGITEAARFDVAVRWPRRAEIRDRRGRALARGHARRRVYPFGALAGSAVGHLGVVRAEDGAASSRYEAGDFFGASGLEEAYDDRLAGAPATKLVVEARDGERLRVLGRRRGHPGRSVRTTLDVDVQRAAQEAFGATIGGAVVLDPANGNLLAAVSSSPFDPNGYVGVSGVAPFDRALSGLYPPGSAMKVVTASAALDAGVVTPASRLTGPQEYKGVRNFESGEFGTIDFATAVRFSVNTAFAQVAEELGGRRLTRYARAFGFNRAPRMALEAATSSFPPPESLSDVMWASIGQAQVLATPLEMASVAATVANGGKRMEPRASFLEPARGRRVLKRATARTMNRLMQGVVSGGTGVAARVPGVVVAGKTGTAEVDVDGERRNHAWFICFAPADDPEVAVAVVSEYGGVGGEVAAPLAGAILARVLPLVT